MSISRKSVFFFAALALHLLVSSPTDAKAHNYNEQAPQLTEAELAQILAPVALYPDSLLTHVIIASTYPLEIVQAHRWREDNGHLDAASLMELAQQKGWDASVTALVAFPNVLERLSSDLNWTQSLGEAFLLDEEAVLDSIQYLRQKAEKAKSLKEMENVRVVKVERQIIIEPAHREVVYVPYYDTRVVYGNWRWHRYPPVYWDFRPKISVSFSNRFGARFHWSPGIHINFNYFFGAFKWHRRHIVVTPHYHTRHYRSHKRIAISHGAKRWQHNIVHRRGVGFRTHQLNTRYKQPLRSHRFHEKTHHQSFKHKLGQSRSSYSYKGELRDGKKYRNHRKLEHASRGQTFRQEKRTDSYYKHRSDKFNSSSHIKKDRRPRSEYKQHGERSRSLVKSKTREKGKAEYNRKRTVTRERNVRVKEK